MKATTADIIAALRGDQAALARVRGGRGGSGRGNWSRTVEGIVAADRLAELDAEMTHLLDVSAEDAVKYDAIDALRPPCPTCGGNPNYIERVNAGYGTVNEERCPDCVDGKVSIEQLVATYNAVMADGALPRNHHLRRVKP